MRIDDEPQPARRRACRSAERTAATALAAGLPGLLLTGAAALSANALAIWADLLLTLIDAAALSAVWWTARRGSRRPDEPPAAAEAHALVFVGLCMALSLALVTLLAMGRLLSGGVALGGPGVGLALVQNMAYALINGWILRRWCGRMRAAPGPFLRSQVRLFSDKLSCNLILAASLGATLTLDDMTLVAAIDAATSVLLVAMSAWWCGPVLALTWRRLVRPAAGAGSV